MPKRHIQIEAKILGLPFGRNTLFQKLRERGIFFTNRNEPNWIFLHVLSGLYKHQREWRRFSKEQGSISLPFLVAGAMIRK